MAHLMELEIDRPVWGFPHFARGDDDLPVPKDEKKGYDESKEKLKQAEEKANEAKEAMKRAKANLLLADADFATAKRAHTELKRKIMEKNSAKRRKLRQLRYNEDAEAEAADDFVHTDV